MNDQNEEGMRERVLVPRAGLLHLRQTGPTSDYKIYGAPGAAPPLTNINVRYANGNTETIVRSAVDGSFAIIRGRAAGS